MPAQDITTEAGANVTTETSVPISTEGIVIVMNPFPATIPPSSNLRLVVTPEDASGKPAQAPGPLVWAFTADTPAGSGVLTPSTDGTSCLLAASAKQGLVKVTCGIPTVPSVSPVEFDITVALPLATQLVPSVQAA